jgi:hypothetical protein
MRADDHQRGELLFGEQARGTMDGTPRREGEGCEQPMRGKYLRATTSAAFAGGDRRPCLKLRWSNAIRL